MKMSEHVCEVSELGFQNQFLMEVGRLTLDVSDTVL